MKGYYHYSLQLQSKTPFSPTKSSIKPLVSYNELTGKIGAEFFSNQLVVFAYSMTANWFLIAMLMATQAKALGYFSKAFSKNTLVYPRKIFWGCLLLAAPLILVACALVSGFALFDYIAN